MYSNVIAIVPARGGSKGLIGKNVRDLCGKPLYRHSVDAALDAGISKVIVSTDIDEIFNDHLPAEVAVVRRLPQLAGDNVPMRDVLAELISEQEITQSTVVLLQPTSPLRRPAHIISGLNEFQSGLWKLVMSVCIASSSVLKWGTLSGNGFTPLSDPKYCFSNRQSLPTVFRPNGALYVFDADEFRLKGDFTADAIGTVLMTDMESLDIDTQVDFELCQKALQGVTSR